MTINVSRELLADLLGNDHDKRIMAERHLLAMLANAPSPAGVDVVGWYRMDDRKTITPYPSVCATWHKMGVKVGAAYSDSAQAIIDGLRDQIHVAHEKVGRYADQRDQLSAELAAIKAQGVVMPEPMKRGDEGGSGEYGAAMIRGYNACLREVARLNAAPVQQVSVPDEMRSLAQRLREYNQNPHHINPMSEAFHILVADAANAISTACVPKEIAAAITWSEHLLFECGALTSTRAPSVHVYNKTFAAVNEARAMLAAAPAAPAADAWIPVSERMPGDQGHDSEEVLCFLNGHCSLLDNECRQGGGWGIRLGYYDADIGTFRVFGRPESHVTHWMPLPAAPAARRDQGVPSAKS